MMRPDAKVEKVYLYPKPVDFRNAERVTEECKSVLVNRGWIIGAVE